MGSGESTIEKNVSLCNSNKIFTQEEFTLFLSTNSKEVHQQCMYHGYKPKLILNNIDKKYLLEFSFCFDVDFSILDSTKIYGEYIATITDREQNMNIVFAKTKYKNINKLSCTFIDDMMKLFNGNDAVKSNLKGIFYQKALNEKLKSKFGGLVKNNNEIIFSCINCELK